MAHIFRENSYEAICNQRPNIWLQNSILWIVGILYILTNKIWNLCNWLVILWFFLGTSRHLQYKIISLLIFDNLQIQSLMSKNSIIFGMIKKFKYVPDSNHNLDRYLQFIMQIDCSMNNVHCNKCVIYNEFIIKVISDTRSTMCLYGELFEMTIVT